MFLVRILLSVTLRRANHSDVSNRPTWVKHLFGMVTHVDYLAKTTVSSGATVTRLRQLDALLVSSNTALEKYERTIPVNSMYAKVRERKNDAGQAPFTPYRYRHRL